MQIFEAVVFLRPGVASILRSGPGSICGPSIYGPSIYGPSIYGPSVYGLCDQGKLHDNTTDTDEKETDSHW